MELARHVMDGDFDVVDDIWADLTEMDYTGITVPIKCDGLGDGMVHLCAILEAAGKYALPVPLPETLGAVVPLIKDLGNSSQKQKYLPSIANGGLKTSIALHDTKSESLPEAIQCQARENAENVVLDGTKTLVPFGGNVDIVIVAARTQNRSNYNGISLYLVNTDDQAVSTQRLDTLDRTRPMYKLDISGMELDATAARLGPLHGAGSSLATALDKYIVATSAMLVGGAERAVNLSAEYGNERKQYSQPIGRFQAVKHRIVDMWIDMEATRSLMYYAAWALENENNNANDVAALKTFGADRLTRIFSDGMKNHGGTGFTWGHDGHIYLKQAKSWRNFVHTREKHADDLISSIQGKYK